MTESKQYFVVLDDRQDSPVRRGEVLIKKPDFPQRLLITPGAAAFGHVCKSDPDGEKTTNGLNVKQQQQQLRVATAEEVRAALAIENYQEVNVIDS